MHVPSLLKYPAEHEVQVAPVYPAMQEVQLFTLSTLTQTLQRVLMSWHEEQD
jgi:hypothetical protein